MGFCLTLLYICLSLLSPASIYPGLADYRIELIIAILAIIFSVPRIFTSNFLRTPQVYLLIGLLTGVFLSQAAANHWVGGGVIAAQDFLKTTIVFFLVLLNVRSLSPLKIISLSLAAIAIFFVIKGAQAYWAGDSSSMFVLMHSTTLGTIMRIRGLGVLNDPNDLAQFLLVVIPLLWVNWERGRAVHNTSLVLVPAMILIVGIYLTHSRGALVGLLVIMLLAFKDRLGAVTSAIAVMMTGAALVALNFSGGRDISMEAGLDRMAAWGAGLEFFKSSPLFGIGYGTFADRNFGLTAHNSFVLCLAELGIVGYSFWLGMLLFTLFGLNAVAAAKPEIVPGRLGDSVEQTPGPDEQHAPNRHGTHTATTPVHESDDLQRWAKLLRISLAGFIAAAWFLSRSYVLTLYLLLGMAAALIELASRDNGSVALPQPASFFTWIMGADLVSVTFLYTWLRLRTIL